jgi:hypothetical protein
MEKKNHEIKHNENKLPHVLLFYACIFSTKNPRCWAWNKLSSWDESSVLFNETKADNGEPLRHELFVNKLR